MAVPNKRVGNQKLLTVTKTVDGSYGNKYKKFTFTFNVTGASKSEEFIWSINGKEQTTKLHPGDTFELKHNDSVTIEFDSEREVTISEDSEGYTPKFVLSTDTAAEAGAQNTDTRTFTVSSDTLLSVTNTLAGTVPTGIWLPIKVLIAAGVILLLAIIFTVRRSRKLKKYIKEKE